VDFALSGNFTPYVELWGAWNFGPVATVEQFSADAALAYAVTPDLQLEAGRIPASTLPCRMFKVISAFPRNYRVAFRPVTANPTKLTYQPMSRTTGTLRK